MTTQRLKLPITLCVTLLVAACAAPPLAPDPGAELSPDGLMRMTGTNFDEVWIRPGMRLTGHVDLVLEPTQVSFRAIEPRSGLDSPRLRSDRRAFPISRPQQARIEQGFRTRLSQALDSSPHFSRLDDARPDALTLRAELVDFVSTAPPDGALGQTIVYASSVSEATLIVELRDGRDGPVLARAIEHSRAGPRSHRLIRADEVNRWTETDLQFQRSARNVRDLLEELRTLNPT